MKNTIFILALLILPAAAKATDCAESIKVLSDWMEYNVPLAILADDARDAAADAFYLRKGNFDPKEFSEGYINKVDGRPAKINATLSNAYSRETQLRTALNTVRGACK